MIRSLIHQFEYHANGNEADVAPDAGTELITPHGGKLVQRVWKDWDSKSTQHMPLLEVPETVIMDACQIATGTFSPLEGFMGREVLESVLVECKLPDGQIWPLPILLQLGLGVNSNYPIGESIGLT